MTKVIFAIRRDDGDLDIIMSMNNSGERWGNEEEFNHVVEIMQSILEVELETKIELIHNVCLDLDVYEIKQAQ